MALVELQTQSPVGPPHVRGERLETGAHLPCLVGMVAHDAVPVRDAILGTAALPLILLDAGENRSLLFMRLQEIGLVDRYWCDPHKTTFLRNQ